MYQSKHLRLILILLLLLVTSGSLRADPRNKRVAVLLRFVLTNGPTYSVSVPQAEVQGLMVPLQVSERERWTVALNANEEDKELTLNASSSSRIIVKGEQLEPEQILKVSTELVYDRPIIVLKAPDYTLEVTLSTR